MVRLTVYDSSRRVPADFPQAGPAYLGLSTDEQMELVRRGIWAESGRGNWSRVAPDGSVWAGGTVGKVAKVRGKNGRRIGWTREKLPAEQRRRTRSMQLSAVAMANLERLAAERAQGGRKVTVSMVVEEWARQLPTEA